MRNASAIDEREFLALWTMPRSGTHYARTFLINYLRHLAGQREPVPLEQHQIVSDRVAYIRDPSAYPGPAMDYRPFGYRDFTADHLIHPLGEMKRAIILLRNPFDFLVSHHFYFHCRDGSTPAFGEQLDHGLNMYVRGWRHLDRFQRDRAGSGRVYLYEHLMRDPATTFGDMIAFCELPRCEAAFAFALDASAFGQARGVRPLKGVTVVRDGRIGQWRSYFTPDLLARSQDTLESAGVSLSMFDRCDIAEAATTPLDR